MQRLLSIVLLAAAAGFPQTQPPARKAPPKSEPQVKTADPSDRFPIAAIRVEGNANYTAAQILSVAGLKVGDMIVLRDLENARDRLTATGAFESIGYSYEADPTPKVKAYVVTLKVAEVNPVFPLRFEDLGVPDSELLQALQQKDVLFNPKKVPA